MKTSKGFLTLYVHPGLAIWVSRRRVLSIHFLLLPLLPLVRHPIPSQPCLLITDPMNMKKKIISPCLQTLSSIPMTSSITARPPARYCTTNMLVTLLLPSSFSSSLLELSFSGVRLIVYSKFIKVMFNFCICIRSSVFLFISYLSFCSLENNQGEQLSCSM